MAFNNNNYDMNQMFLNMMANDPSFMNWCFQMMNNPMMMNSFQNNMNSFNPGNMNPQMMMNMMKQQWNNMPNNQMNNNIQNPINIIFSKDMTTYNIITNFNETLGAVISKYINVTNDNNINMYIVNGKKLNESLTVGEAGLMQGTVVNVVPTQDILGAGH